MRDIMKKSRSRRDRAVKNFSWHVENGQFPSHHCLIHRIYLVSDTHRLHLAQQQLSWWTLLTDQLEEE
jgi:hypothetical protein